MYKKPKVLILVDNSNWCWSKTMGDMAYCLPDFDCTLMSAYKFKTMAGDCSKWDFIYCRGYASQFFDKQNEHKIIPFISTLSTGNSLVDQRLEEMREYAVKGWAVVVQNKVAYHKCIEDGYHRVFLIPNGVNTNIYRPAIEKTKKKLIGIAGNNRDGRADLKGFNHLIPAVDKIKSVTLTQASVKNPLTYEEMVRWYQSLTVYAQPSHSEGCSNSVMEALACGLPCLICKGVGYHGEVCRDALEYDDGEVIFVKRDVKDIKDKIQLLLKDKKLYKRLSENARRFAMQHDWIHIADKYRQLFNEFLPEIKKLNSNEEEIEKALNRKVKYCNNIKELSDEIQDMMFKSRIPLSVGAVINLLQMKGYMK